MASNEPEGNVNRLREERRDLFDLLYGDEQFDSPKGSDLGDEALFDEAVLRPLEDDGAAVRAGEREVADGDVFRAFEFEAGVGEGEADVT